MLNLAMMVGDHIYARCDATLTEIAGEIGISHQALQRFVNGGNLDPKNFTVLVRWTFSEGDWRLDGTLRTDDGVDAGEDGAGPDGDTGQE